MKLENRVADVTGASSGVGREIALLFAKEGAKVVAVARRAERLAALEEQSKELAGEIVAYAGDISLEETNTKMIDFAVEKFGKLDILINNAGMAVGTEKVFESSMEDYDVVIDTNVKGVLYMIKAVVPQMVERNAKGVVVNMGSVAGNIAYGGGAVYCGSKAAIRYITDGLRIDLMDTPIRVTCIEPGLVETEFSIIRFRGDKDKAKAVYTGIDALTADDIGAAVAYVCNLPENVQIPEMILTPANQADSINKYYQK